MIENMSGFCCPGCNQVTSIFGYGGARKEAEKLGVPFLGEIPLDMEIRKTSDDGRPIVAIEPESAHARLYIGIARQVWSALSSGHAGKPAPRIVIE
jgi:ATP-binding protein involved in chromosome partitioning